MAGCAQSDDRAVAVAVIGDANAPFVTTGRLPAAAELVRAATTEGLVGLDAQGQVVPGLADRWIVTDDGLSYIFRLRDGTWSDGTPISGETARSALSQAIAALRGRPFADDLGAISDVRAMAGRVVEIRLSQQSPDLLLLLAQPELGLAWRGRGAGPMKLKRTKQIATLTPISPEDRGLPPQEHWEQRKRKLQLMAQPAATALGRFAAGEVDYVLGGQFQDWPRLEAQGVARGAIRVDPVSGLFGLVVAKPDGFLDDPANREALAMAIDREALAKVLRVPGWQTTTRLITPGTADDNGSVGERWPTRSLVERRAEAASRVTRWKGARKTVSLRLALPDGPGSDLLFRQLAADFAAIGLTLTRVSAGQPADLQMIDKVARYQRAMWFLNQLSCQNMPATCSPGADRLVAAARSEADLAKRADLFAQAEAQLTMANGYIPLGVPIRWSIVAGDGLGFVPNWRGLHPLLPMAIRPK